MTITKRYCIVLEIDGEACRFQYGKPQNELTDEDITALTELVRAVKREADR